MYGYIQQFNKAVQNSNGKQLAPLLKKNAISKKPSKLPVLHNIEAHIAQIRSVDDYCSGQAPAPWDDALALHFKAVIAVQKQAYVEAYAHQANLSQLMTKQFGAEATNWLMPTVDTINVDLRRIAILADDELTSKGQKSEKLEDAARLLNTCLSHCIRDGSLAETSKKWGTLNVINNLFKIYFSLNNLKLCKNLTRPVETRGFPDLKLFPASQVVTYKFFVGRLATFDGHFKKADEELSYAFRRCTRRNENNKRTILLYLIPVKLMLGVMPKQSLLEQHNFTQFVDIVNAVQSGNLRLFNEALATHQDFFIEKGIYLILEKSKILAYRNLVKKVCLILATTKIRLLSIAKAFEWLGVPTDIEEIECILANLIYSGYIKGYLSHQLGFLVVSASKAFPPLPEVPALQ